MAIYGWVFLHRDHQLWRAPCVAIGPGWPMPWMEWRTPVMATWRAPQGHHKGMEWSEVYWVYWLYWFHANSMPIRCKFDANSRLFLIYHMIVLGHVVDRAILTEHGFWDCQEHLQRWHSILQLRNGAEVLRHYESFHNFKSLEWIRCTTIYLYIYLYISIYI